MLLTSVRKTIETHRLLVSGDHVLAGVSGGADSVALLLLLCRLAPAQGFRVTAAHLNHGLRGRTAADDARFTAALAARLGVDCISGCSNVRRRARNRHLSLEMAAREARYAFFKRAARKTGATVVATAHTANDQAETVLLNLVRGAGPDGLSGIPRRTRIAGIDVARPLLEVRRTQIEAFLQREQQSWREDATNHDPAFLRNRVRHELLPLLQRRFNPSIRDALCRTATIMTQENQWLTALTRELLCQAAPAPDRLAVDPLRNLPPAARHRVLRRWLAGAGVPIDVLSFRMVQRLDVLLRRKRGSGRLDLPAGRHVRRVYDYLLLADRDEETPRAFRQRLPLRGETLVPQAGVRITTSVAPGLIKDRPRGPGALPARASLARAAIGRHAMFVRTWRRGDRMAPLGIHGSRKLQDIFVDAKVPATRRHGIPVFECSGRDHLDSRLPGCARLGGYPTRRSSGPSTSASNRCEGYIDPPRQA